MRSANFNLSLEVVKQGRGVILIKNEAFAFHGVFVHKCFSITANNGAKCLNLMYFGKKRIRHLFFICIIFSSLLFFYSLKHFVLNNCHVQPCIHLANLDFINQGFVHVQLCTYNASLHKETTKQTCEFHVRLFSFYCSVR